MTGQVGSEVSLGSGPRPWRPLAEGRVGQATQ